MNYFFRAINSMFLCLSLFMCSSFVWSMDWDAQQEDIKLLEAMEYPVEDIPQDYFEKVLLIEEALKNGGDVNMQDSNGNTPLHILLNIEGDEQYHLEEDEEDEEDEDISYAEYAEKIDEQKTNFFSSDIYPILSNYNPDLTIQNKMGQTPLHIAVLTGNYSTVKNILDMEPKSKYIRDINGRTPLDYAQINWVKHTIQNLLF